MAQDKVSVEISIEEKKALAALARLTKGVDNLGDEAVETGKKTDKAFASFAGNLAAIGASKALGFISSNLKSVAVDSLKMAASFEKSVIEINTILPKTTKLTEKQIQALRDMATEYGSSAQEQASSFYSIVSAGVTDASEATELLNQANKLAIGGIAGTAESIDILTSAINSYGAENLSAQDAADSLFTAVKLGKTTVSEMASSLALAIPSAKAASISFDLLNASVATLTTKGFNTATAVTRINALLTAFATKGKDLGKTMDINAVKTDGLITVLKRLEIASGGNSAELTRLLGSSEAVQVAQTLMADGAADLSRQFEGFASKTGAASDSFDLMAESASFSYDKLIAEIGDLKISMGQAFGPAALAGIRALTSLLERLGRTDAQVKIAKDGVKGLREEIKIMENQVRTITNNPLNLPDFLLGDADELSKKVEQYKAELAEVLKGEESLMLSRTKNASHMDAIQESIFGKKPEARDEFVTGGVQSAPAADGGLVPEDAAVLASKKKLNEELRLMQAESDISQTEKELQRKDLTAEKRESELQALLVFEQQKAESAYQLELQKNANIEDAGVRALANKKALKKKELAIDIASKNNKDAIAKQEMEIEKRKVEGYRKSLSMALSLAKEGTAEQKALAIANATINTYMAATRAYRDYPYPANIAVSALTVASGLKQVQEITKASFATGGVVGGFGGATTGGDNTTANVRTGEMMLNAQQQRQLFDIANKNVSADGSGQVIEITSIVQVDEREIARSVRNQRLEGFAV